MGCLEPLYHSYRRGGLTKYEEQTEADSNSFISVPNRIRSDHKNGWHRDKFDEMVGGFIGRTYLPQMLAPEIRALESGQKIWEIRQRGREREPQQSGRTNTHRGILEQPSCMTLDWHSRRTGLKDMQEVRLRQPVREKPTSKSQENVGERYVPGEKIEGLGPVPSCTPNVFHFMRKCQ